MKTLVKSLIFLASSSGSGTVTAFTPSNPSAIITTSLALGSSRYNDDYYRDYSNNANYNNNNRNSNYNRNNDNYVTDRNSGRFDNSVGSASFGTTSYGGNNRRQQPYNSRGNNGGRRSGYGSSRDYRSYDNYSSNDSYRGGGGVATGDYYYNNRPYDRIGSSENFRMTSSPNSQTTRRNSYNNNSYYYGDYDYYNPNNNYVLQNRRGGYADEIGGRSRYSTPSYTSGGYASPQGLSEDFRTGREGPMSSMTSRQRQSRNRTNSNRIQDYYTPGEREWMSQRGSNSQGLRYGWQQQYDRERGNVRRGSGEDFRRGSSLSRISDYFTPLERERRQMSDNRALGRGQGSYGSGSGQYGYGNNINNSRGGVDARRGGYYEDYPDYGFDNYDDEYDYFENDGGYSSGSRRRARNGSTWDNLLNMFRN